MNPVLLITEFPLMKNEAQIYEWRAFVNTLTLRYLKKGPDFGTA